MGMFDYRNYSSKRSFELSQIGKLLATYAVSNTPVLDELIGPAIKELSETAANSPLFLEILEPWASSITIRDIAESIEGKAPIKMPSEVLSALIDIAQIIYNEGGFGDLGAIPGIFKFLGLDNAIIDGLQEKLVDAPGTDLYIDFANQKILFGNDNVDIPQSSMLLDMLSGVLGEMLDFSNFMNSGWMKGAGRLPEGYEFLTHEDLGLNPDEYPYNAQGLFTLPSPIWGDKFIKDGSNMGPEIGISVERDASGKVISIGISLSQTNDPVDFDDYTAYQFRELFVNVHTPILQAVKDFAIANGVDPSQITFGGYSHGGTIANILADAADKMLGGFFEQSNFMAFAPAWVSPSGRAISFGAENDPVHRIIGDFENMEEAFRWALNDPDFVFPSLKEVLAATESGEAYSIFTQFLVPTFKSVQYHDKDTVTGMDNTFFFLSQTLQPDELAVGDLYEAFFLRKWAHISGIIADYEERIYNSTWYDLTYEDSFVILADLSAEDRKTAWVEKRDIVYSQNTGMTTFFVGSDQGEKMRGDYGNDYMDGAGGDDTFQLSGGHDQIDGGEGTDTLIIEGSIEGLKVYDLGDGKLAFYVEGVGLTIVQNVEAFQIEERQYSIANDRLEDDGWNVFGLFDKDIAFDKFTSGTDGDDELGGDVVFAGAGNDFLLGNNDDNLLVGGEGADRLNGGAGNDALYGGEGNDILRGGAGNDVLNGGVGTDMFVFNEVNKGEIDIIEDFQKDLEVDIIVLSMFDDYDDLRENMYQDGENVEIDLGRGHTIVIQDYDLENISAMNFVFA